MITHVEPDQLTGALVAHIRKHNKLNRVGLWELCQFPDSRSAARVDNIERKDSWKEGDRERVAAVLNALLASNPAPDFEAVDDAARDAAEFVANARATAGIDVAEVIDATEIEDDNNGVTVVETPLDIADRHGWTDQPQSVETIELPTDVDARSLDGDEELDELVAVDLSEVTPPFRLTQSEAKTWKRCPRKWWLEIYEGWAWARRDPTGHLAVGDRVHRALAAWYVPEGQERTDPRDALERAITEDWTVVRNDAAEHGIDELTLATMAEKFNDACSLERAMVEGFLQWVRETGIDAELSVVQPEKELEYFMELDVDGETVPMSILGKIDAVLLRRSDGAQLLNEVKTAASLTSAIGTLKQNEQLLHYLLLLFLTSPEGTKLCDGALYSMLRKVKRTPQAKPPFYDRVEVPHNTIEIDSYKRHLLSTARSIVRARRALDAGESHHDVVPPNPTGTCSWDCAFFPICSMFDDGSPGVNDMLNTMYVRVDPLARYDGSRD